MIEYLTVKTFDEALAAIKARFECVPFENTDRPAYSPTGRRYFELMCGERITEGGATKTIHLSEQAAAQAWLDAMLRFGAGKRKLYWRIEPELDHFGFKIWREEVSIVPGQQYGLFGYPVYRIYSRQDFD
jgi:hypothetical protein